MKQRDRRKTSKTNVNMNWKVHDDRSGFTLYNTQVARDHKGVLTDKRHVDPPFPTEEDQIKVFMPRELPFTRLETIRYVDNNPLAPKGTHYWENWNTITWDTWFTKWEKA